MQEYTSLSSYKTGNGKQVFAIQNDKDREFGCPDLIDKEIKLDGKVCTIERVETFAIHKIKKGMAIGIIVKF